MTSHKFPIGMNRHRFPIGTKYKPIGKHRHEQVVVDQLTTFNSKGGAVSIRYVSAHVLLGQRILDHDVSEITIARGIENLTNKG